jgi:cytochrome c biogenesis protein CcdA
MKRMTKYALGAGIYIASLGLMAKKTIETPFNERNDKYMKEIALYGVGGLIGAGMVVSGAFSMIKKNNLEGELKN